VAGGSQKWGRGGWPARDKSLGGEKVKDHGHWCKPEGRVNSQRIWAKPTGKRRTFRRKRKGKNEKKEKKKENSVIGGQKKIPTKLRWPRRVEEVKRKKPLYQKEDVTELIVANGKGNGEGGVVIEGQKRISRKDLETRGEKFSMRENKNASTGEKHNKKNIRIYGANLHKVKQ